MFFTYVKRIIKSGFYNFLRNGFVSLSSIFVMIVTLMVIGSTIFFSAILNTSLDAVKDKVDINVYFVTTAAESDILPLKKTLETLPEVEKVTYISQDQVLANFKKRHENDQFTLQALDELNNNPLGATLTIKAKQPSQYESVANFLKSKSVLGSDGNALIDKVNYFDNKTTIDRLSNIVDSTQKLGFIFIIFFIAVSILITFNTIRLVIFIAREEISVMRLVGASTLFIRGPFIVAGVLYGVVAGLITLVLFYPITLWFGKSTVTFIGINIFSYYTANFGEFFLLIIGSGIAIGAISSYLAAHKYLKV